MSDLIRNCKVCTCFMPEEIGDSDYGSLVADESTCTEHYDMDDQGNIDEKFDREIVRNCCKLDFWKVDDPETTALLPNLDAALSLFKERHGE